MTKLLMLITSLAGGGAERVASELSLNLSPDIKRKIVTLTDEVSYPSEEPPISMNFKFGNFFFMKLLYVLFVGTVRYKKHLNSYRPEFSLSFLILDNIINIISSSWDKNVHTVISVHIALSMKFKKYKLKKIITKSIGILYSHADLIIAVSEGVKTELITDFNINPDKIKVVYNPVDCMKIKKLSSEDVYDEEWFNENIPIIINIGRLTQQKGQWHLIRSFSKVRQAEKCRLIIRGNGELKPYLDAVIKDYNLNKDVKFLDWKDNPYKYISKAAFFVSSSLWEALPYALTETMACGCPIIATDCKYGPNEILNNGEFGILTPPMDGLFHDSCSLTREEQLLADKMIYLLRNEDLRIKYAEKSTLRSADFDISKTIKVYNDIFLSKH